MRISVWLGLILCFIVRLSLAQFPVAPDVVYDFIKSNSIHRNKVDWGKVDNRFFSALSNSHSLQDTMEAFTSVLQALDDVHSQIYLNNQYYGYWHANEGPGADRLSNLVQLAAETSGKIKCDLLEDQFAYIRIPAMTAYGPDEVNRYARMLRDSVDRMSQMNVKGFILDLRLNTGGNMYPMLSGVGHLLGDGDIAYEVDLYDQVASTWKIENGNFLINDFPVTHMDSALVKGLDEIPVVILIGPVTASSGSNIAIAFKTRKHTVFLGESTAAGYTTSNGYFQFAPNLVMNFAVNYVADSNLNLYPVNVDPDILIEGGDNFEKLYEDQKIKRALLWLKGCTH
ncbi:MAG TPA: S41 family peptidase [Saprospiraceae bacterium]|nr:S41 family peptidase [Saprospiraceae bacterium]